MENTNNRYPSNKFNNIIMNIYKLKYSDKETAITDLINKEVYNDELKYGDGIHAVVEIGFIISQDGIYNNEGNIIVEPIYIDGYHYDVMSENEIEFNNNEIQVNNPKHMFAGH